MDRKKQAGAADSGTADDAAAGLTEDVFAQLYSPVQRGGVSLTETEAGYKLTKVLAESRP